MNRPDAPDTPDTLDQHPLGRFVATSSKAGAAMCTELAQAGTNHNNRLVECEGMTCQTRMDDVDYLVEHNAGNGSDTKRCGTPAQSNRFTLHCQPRDQVFWQHTTTWYRKTTALFMLAEHSLYYNS